MSKLLDYTGLGHFKEKYDASMFGVKKNYVQSAYINNTGGLVNSTTSGSIATGFIPVSKGDSVVWYNGFSSTSSDYCLCGYDSNKQWISGQYWTCNSVPSRTISSSNNNIAYIRATMSASSSTTPYITVNGTKMWEMSTPVSGAVSRMEDMVVDSSSAKVDTSVYSYRNYSIAYTGKYGTSTTYKHKILPVSEGEKYKITPSTEAGSRYAFFTAIQSGTSGGDLPLVTGTEVTPVNYEEYVVVTIPEGCVGLAFYCGSSPSYSYEPIIYKLINTAETSTEATRFLNLDSSWEEVTLSFGRLGTGEGTFLSETSSGFCFTSAIQARRGDVFRGRWNMRNRSNNGSAVYKTNANNSVGVSPLIDVANNGEQDIEFTIEEDCYITLQIASTTIDGAVLYVKHPNPAQIPGNSQKSNPYLFENEMGYHRVMHWKNGAIANKANTNGIHCEDYDIPEGVTKLIFKTTRPLPAGHTYWLSYRWLNSEGASVGATDASANTDFKNPISVPSGAVRFYPSLWEKDENNTSIQLRYDSMDGYESWICPYDPGYLAYMKARSESESTPVGLNRDRQIDLYAINRLNYNQSSPYHDYTLLISSDAHGDSVSDSRAVDAANGNSVIDAYVNCGDILSNYHNPSEIAEFQEYFSKLTKPGYVVPGNHDAGNAYYVGYGGSHTQMYEAFTKPMVDAGYLAEGEYTENLPYWYHDNATYKVRLIGVYEWDNPLDLASNSYWTPVTYDSTAPKMAFSTAYAVNDVVNCGVYTDYSFKCTTAVTTPQNQVTDTSKIPCYKIQRGMRVIGEAQANWFLNTLVGTPANYGVIVITHQPLCNNIEIVSTSKFTQKGTTSTSIQNCMATEFLADALVAFKNGEQFSENVAMSGNATFMNTQGSNTYAYSVAKDFSQKNSGVYILGMICGHRHKDIVHHYDGIYQIGVTCASVADRTYARNSDIRRSRDTAITRDSLTLAAFASGRIGLCKWGVNIAMDGTPRDYEVINTATGETGDVTKKMFDEVSQMVGGAGSTRPSSPSTGTVFFDTSIGKPIWWSGSAWVDATGTSV